MSAEEVLPARFFLAADNRTYWTLLVRSSTTGADVLRQLADKLQIADSTLSLSSTVREASGDVMRECWRQRTNARAGPTLARTPTNCARFSNKNESFSLFHFQKSQRATRLVAFLGVFFSKNAFSFVCTCLGERIARDALLLPLKKALDQEPADADAKFIVTQRVRCCVWL